MQPDKYKGQIMVENNSADINIAGFFTELKKKKKSFMLSIGFFFILGTAYSVLATPMYKSILSIYPTEEKSPGGALNDIQGVASAFGFNLDGGTKSTFYIPDVVKSRRLSGSVVEKLWKTEAYPAPVNLIAYWEIDDQTKITRRLKKWVMSIFPKGKGDIHLKYVSAAIKELDTRVVVKEGDSGLIVVSVKMEEPKLASDIANYYGQFIKKYIAEELEIQSRNYRQFIEDRLAIAKSDLEKSEEALTEFRKLHTITLEPPETQLQRGRLLRNVEVNQEVYITLRQQYELAKIEELKELPIINILDIPEPAAEKDSPKRMVIIIGSILAGGFIGIAIAALTIPSPGNLS